MINELPFIFGNLWIFGFTILVVLLALAEVGYRVGLRLYIAKDEARRSQISGVQGAVLGLLALLLGFTFSMAAGRYETRRAMVLKEANAAGTAWLRAGLLPEAHRAPARELFRQFIEARIKYQKVSDDPVQLAEGLKQSGAIEMELWQHAEAAAKEAPTPITASFIVALNEMIDTDGERIDSWRNRIPEGVWLLLVLVASVGCFTSGYGSGSQGARSGFTNVCLPLLITAVIVIIFDFLHTHQGIVSISQQPMIDLLETMRAGVEK